MADIQGELIPLGGGDPITLCREVMVVGRREVCDIHLDFPNVSGRHCELSFREGYWFIRDLGSTNGIKVNNQRVMQRPLRPGDEISIGKRRYTIRYNLPVSGQQALEAVLSEEEDIRSQSLLEKAGLSRHRDEDDEDDDD